MDDFLADKESVDSALEQHDGDMDTDCGHDVLVDAPTVTLKINYNFNFHICSRTLKSN